MEIYSVGGAVRDGLLNLEVQDRDFVVVGATPQALQELGFVPVGRDFPVFLHPETHEEYALARTERKTAPGYRGFSFHADPNVTLEEDLARRDLTINAMAQDAHGRLIDPFGGQRDLKARVLRHVGPAFVEDPVRILRLARFAARFTAFSIAPETLALVRQMVAAGEVDALVPERVWQEMARGLMEAQPSRMLQVLAECGALARLAPEIDAAQGGRWQALDRSARQGRSLPVRSAVWLTEAGLGPEAIVRLCQRLRVPAQCSDVARMTARERATIARPDPLAAGEQLALLERCDALRRGERFEMLLAALADLEDIDLHDLRLERLRHALFVVHRVDTAAVAGRAAGGDVGRAVREARLEALTEAMR